MTSFPLRRNQLDVALVAKPLGKLSAVESLVANELRWKVVRHRFVERLVDEDHVVSTTICDANGDRKTSAVCKRHDLRRIAGAALPDGRSPFFAGA
jgi:hypothetical protein